MKELQKYNRGMEKPQGPCSTCEGQSQRTGWLSEPRDSAGLGGAGSGERGPGDWNCGSQREAAKEVYTPNPPPPALWAPASVSLWVKLNQKPKGKEAIKRLLEVSFQDEEWLWRSKQLHTIQASVQQKLNEQYYI